MELCRRCNGTGTYWQVCFQCYGRGHVQMVNAYGQPYLANCPGCWARGGAQVGCSIQEKLECDPCDGKGRIKTGERPRVD